MLELKYKGEDVDFYNTSIENMNFEDKLKYLLNHDHYFEENINTFTFSNVSKINQIGLKDDLKELSFETIGDSLFMDLFNSSIESYLYPKNMEFSISFTGRNNGHLVFIPIDDFQFDYFSLSLKNFYEEYLCMKEERQEEFEELKNIIEKDFYNVVLFDKLCDQIRMSFITLLKKFPNIIKDMEIEQEMFEKAQKIEETIFLKLLNTTKEKFDKLRNIKNIEELIINLIKNEDLLSKEDKIEYILSKIPK